ncbi:hypothetical protein HFP57_13430 [Parasphingopyxis algicola]|uniref:hypothetical protein n=1 Tax=Parasphingopyxis algicola TaxID=2026624 RepID=UPI0015A194FD|nr:hypothetical protein [Parasphingopyxis algicola]QLC25927.1 hypothetical protein HFP57_13430 [Parasphingopyxis algicola]
MASKLRRTSYLSRLGVGTGIGALALVTGACSPGGESVSDSDPGGDVSEPSEAAAPATDSDVAGQDVEPEAVEQGSTDTEGDAATDSY